ncbi:TetR/AcrR family transcriptional regulator [Pseudonocardia sp. WMMC193]|uniref:TetR/AcrR family transcriptional regulator n=1 Tax=Pseudonocardia sp. WMMC193 TaxID=2911965 RepID=UPI001F36F727|nr:helix-turn-helix domain-containing protein [Pseudonocardia sp. WMMC193]MCF7550873.1 TetR/AcrR family transcriptional regulator [Pseudonocardia sp. WMMC193]
MAGSPRVGGPRRRDPERRARILDAAAALAARRGFHAVPMEEIGTAAGIVGSGVYRHFASKEALLVALLDQAMDRLRSEQVRILAEAPDDDAALCALVDSHVAMALRERDVLTVHHRESHSLPTADRRRLRDDQRRYAESWVALLCRLHPDRAAASARLQVHSAIGAIQSILFHRPDLPEAEVAAELARAARACLDHGGADDRGSSARAAPA